MTSTIVTLLLWAVAVGSGLMAGVYFAFSAFIMRSFDSIGTARAVASMNAINDMILRSLFMPLFFGSSIGSLLLALLAIWYWGEAGSGTALFASSIYFFGMFVSTVVNNVPLNNALAKVDENSVDADQVWQHYLAAWTRWNHVRTICSLVASTLSIWLLFVP